MRVCVRRSGGAWRARACRRRLRPFAAWLACCLVLWLPPAASGQGVLPGPPGPWVVDVRGATLALPQSFGFYPPIPAETLVPARGFGFEAGGHLYFVDWGPARIGAGASYVYVRGTSPGDIAMTTRILAPQVSFNFGTSRGWSYLSGGFGAAHVSGRAPILPGLEPSTRGSGVRPAVNVGAGARWFFAPRAAITFDVRLHRVGARAPEPGIPGTPGSLLGGASVGLSFK